MLLLFFSQSKFLNFLHPIESFSLFRQIKYSSARTPRRVWEWKKAEKTHVRESNTLILERSFLCLNMCKVEYILCVVRAFRVWACMRFNLIIQTNVLFYLKRFYGWRRALSLARPRLRVCVSVYSHNHFISMCARYVVVGFSFFSSSFVLGAHEYPPNTHMQPRVIFLSLSVSALGM